MTDVLQDGSDWLEARRHAKASHAVTYHRGAESVSLSATVGMTQWDTQTEVGVETTQGRDYLVRATDLVISGSQVTPVRGDRIVEVIGSETWTFEVAADGDVPVWRYSDQFGKTLRIHTKLVAKA